LIAAVVSAKMVEAVGVASTVAASNRDGMRPCWLTADYPLASLPSSALRPFPRGTKMADLTGRKFDRWTIERRSTRQHRKVIYVCVCDCGTRREVFAESLLRGRSRSCGCLLPDVRKAKRMPREQLRESHPNYIIWKSMRNRCLNPNNKDFAHYGGRGIRVCERWTSFENFVADMGVRPVGMTIERDRNDGDYEPGNCRWASRAEQCQNTRRASYLTHEGRTQSLSQWAREIGVSRSALGARIKRGWPISQMFANRSQLVRAALIAGGRNGRD
jgi:hypothetical protein